ncbi:MAG TPA: pyridoxine 5'-phosphate synthase [Candidatus Brocadiia bacterium]|nr:pyridoxine 5'-phosphate synthase [Planctomycetota bacterium]
MPKLGVNIDHVATIRQARYSVALAKDTRKAYEPDPVTASILAHLGGADVITIHLREDRRHIQERDLRVLRQTVFAKLNLELAASEEIIKIALDEKPDQVTFVPEKRLEVTTEGGFDVVSQKKRIAEVIKRFNDAGIIVSLFIDAEEKQIKASRDAGTQYVELHTGDYANAKDAKERNKVLEKLKMAASMARNFGLMVNAGHGLNYNNVGPIVEELHAEELHIGHSIVSRAIFVGMKEAVQEMKELIYKHTMLRKD